MTTPSSLSAYNNIVPNDLVIPKESEEMNRVLTDYTRLIVDNLNAKEVAIYDESEQAQGQQWFNPNNIEQPRFGLRKVINLMKTSGPGNGLNNFLLVNPQTQAHGITINPNTVITKLSGTATDPNNEFIQLPFIDMSGGNNHIELTMDGTNVILTSNADYSRFTVAYITLEYLQT